MQIIIKEKNIEIKTKLDISCKDDEIIFIITRDNIKYLSKSSFSELKIANNDFQYFPSIIVFVNGVKKIIEKREYSLEIYNEKLILNLNNTLFDNPIIFDIPLEKNIENNFNDNISYFQKQNQILKNEIEKYKKEINNMKFKEINNEEIINQMIEIFKESEVTKNECMLLYNWLNKNKNLKFIRLYSTRIDGDNPSKFHEKCDGKSPTITIIKTKKGYRFGGYTTIPWIKASNWVYNKDPEAFIFSFFYNKKYKIKNENEIAVGSHKIRGPSFGEDNYDIYIWENCTNCNDNQSEIHSFLATQKFELTGEKNFTVDHYEVYLVDIK